MSYAIYTLDARPELRDAIPDLHAACWPAFMLNDPVADEYWEYLYSAFPSYQIAMCDAEDHLIAVGHTIPLVWDGTVADLPAGWDAVLVRGVKDFEAQRSPNTLSALAALVAPQLQGQGLSVSVIQAMKAAAQAHQLSRLIAPVRPSQKSRYPLMATEDYATWRRADGLPVDPWLRVHARLGAEVLRVAPESMRVVGRVSDWERWTGLPFHTSGPYIVPGALVPVEIDREHDVGVYIEPNVWMCHSVFAVQSQEVA